MRRVQDLLPYPNNARTHTDEQVNQIAASIKEFGWTNPVIIHGETIVAGHARVAAARKLGLDKIPCIDRSDMSEAQWKAYVLADNRLAQNAGWDEGLLKLELLELDSLDFDLGLLGFDEKELGKLLQPEPAEGLTDPDEVPEDVEPVTKPGDLWVLGEHRLLCGDSMDVGDVEKLMDGLRADCIVTDPPYAIYGSSTGVSSDIADDKMIRPFFEAMFRMASGHLAEFGHMYVCCDWRSWATIVGAARRTDLEVKNLIIWDKSGSGLGSNYANTYEGVGFFHKLPKSGSMTSGRKTGIRPVFASNIVRHSRPSGADRQHNAAKPVEMLEEFINNSMKKLEANGRTYDEGTRVLDLFAGSGSTLIAAQRAGKQARLMEMEPKFCDVIVARWENFTGQKAVKQ